MNHDFSLAWAVLALPILGFLIQAFLGKRIERAMGRRVVGALAVLPILIAFAIGVKLTLDLSAIDAAHRSIVVKGLPWIDTGQLSIPWELIVDPLSMTMVLIITGIGGLIHLYATGYMSEEREYTRFFTYLNLFVAAMLILVMGNNLGLLFMGWEGVGLCSYLLIGFWYKDHANVRAANKAFVVNRIGDWGLSLALVMIFAMLSTVKHTHIGDGRYLSYDEMLPQLAKYLTLHPGQATVLALLLFVGAAGKSAQFPLYLWLPDAMAGPTPVSALIHAATMVTSGVVLLNRMHIVFENSPTASAIIVVIGAFTALFAAVVAFGQTDIKKVLAYSTVSQLGFMFIACGAGGYWAGMFHVTTHAFFKALLFLGAGAVIHSMSHNQDMRNYGGLRKYLPITTWTMVIGWLAIAAVAIPVGEAVYGFAGAYSKEAILATALGGSHAVVDGFNFGEVAGWVGVGVAVLTSIYMTRLMFLTFFGKEERWRALPVAAHHGHDDEGHDGIEEHGHETPDGLHAFASESPDDALAMNAELVLVEDDPYGFYHPVTATTTPSEPHAHELSGDHTPREVPPSMSIPLIALAILSLGGGYVLAKGEAFQTWLYPEGLKVIDNVPNSYPNLPIISAAAAVGGILLGWFFYRKGLPQDQGWNDNAWRPWRRWARDQFGVDDLATVNAVEGGGELASGIWRFIDIGLIDGIVNGSGLAASWLGKGVRYAQTGYIRLYALVMLAGGVGFLGYLFYALQHVGGHH